MSKYVNRISQFPNRNKIKIISQENDQIIADIVKDDTGLITEGTKLNAEMFNEWDEIVTTAKNNSEEAKEKSTSAESKANEAKTKSEEALEKANEAKITANEAITAVGGSGTRVYFGNELQATIEFSENPIEKINNSVSVNDLFNLIYPIGSIYLSVSSTSPSNLFGGTWTRWGNGRAIVGLNESDNDFTPVEHTGGSKNFQKHNHCVTINESSGLTGNLTFKTYSAATSCEGEIYEQTWSDSGVTPSGTNKDKNVTVATNMNHTHTGSTDYHGTGTSGNLQPYIVCYMWKRVG